ALVERESLGDQVEDIAFVALLHPEEALGAIDVLGQPLEEALEFAHGERTLAAERQRLETVSHQMPVLVLLVIVGVLARAFAFGPIVEEAIRLKQANAEDEGEHDLALGRAQDARTRRQRADFRLERRQPRAVDEIALVEQNDVAVAELIARRL